MLHVRATCIWVLFLAHILFVMNRVFNATLSQRLHQAIPVKSQRINSASFFAWNFSEADEAVKTNFVVLVNFLECELLGKGNEEEDIT